MIYYDPTEGRRGTKLPDGVLHAARPLPGLEELTGADLLLTAVESPLDKVSPKMPQPLLNAFLQVTSKGMLVQRKSGMDLIHSLVDLDAILLRMLRWVGDMGEAWLLTTGTHDEDLKSNVVIDGRTTGVRYTHLMARLTLWQRRGGYYVNLPNDRRIISWCQRWEQSWRLKPELKLVRPRHVILVDAPWWEQLTLIPGVGEKTAVSIGKWLPEGYKTLADALCYLSWPENYNPGDKPDGVGPALFNKVAEWLGMRPGEALRTYEVPEEGQK